MPDTATITVAADPDALKAAMTAVETLRRAEHDFDKAEQAARARLERAQREYRDALARARRKLDAARKQAAKAGISFPTGDPADGATPAARSRSTLKYDDAVKRLPKGDFTVTELAETLGCSLPLAKRFLEQMIDASVAVQNGTRPNPTGRGRAARLYRRR